MIFQIFLDFTTPINERAILYKMWNGLEKCIANSIIYETYIVDELASSGTSCMT